MGKSPPPPDTGTPERMTVAITGSTGLIGGMLSARLAAAGYRVIKLVRREAAAPDEVEWGRTNGRLGLPRLNEADAVVNLAGEPVSGYWTPAKRRRIKESRIDGTRRLAQALADLPHPPRVLVSASATGFYGDRGAEMLTEDHPAGEGFLAGVCRGWEAACEPAREAGIRVANARLGVVLTEQGGALPRLLRLFQRNLGAELGNGRQYMPWIGAADTVAGLLHILHNSGLEGPVNLTAPVPVTNAELTRALLDHTGRRAAPRIPAPMLRLTLGGMAGEMLLASQRAIPARLLDSGYSFIQPHLEDLLAGLPGK